MINVHATKKLSAKLPLDKAGGIMPPKKQATGSFPGDGLSDNPLSGWHANLITLQRRNCVLMVHDATRFPVFMKGLKKADFVKFDWLFQDAFMNTLLKLDANNQQMNVAGGWLAHCQFDTATDRSTLGTMNRMKGDIEHLLWYDKLTIDEVSSYKLGVWLSGHLCSVKGSKESIRPREAMMDLLS